MRSTYFSLILVLLLLASGHALSAQQVPRAFPYQGVARDGNAVVTGTVGLRFALRQGSLNGPVVFQESQVADANPEGVFAVHIGLADPGAFAAIDWAQGPYFLQVGLDPQGGANYTDLGTTPILSVPYALYAAAAGTAARSVISDSATIAATARDDQDRDPVNEIQTLSLNGQQLSLSKNGGAVSLPSAPVYSAGTGIGISNNVITNTAPAVNPTLALNGQNLSVFPGGSSVVLPAAGGSNWAVSGVNIYRVTGNVGIGTEFPTSRLTVQSVFSSLNSSGSERTRISISTGDSGFLETYGPNGSSNIRLSSLSGNSNNGFISIMNSFGEGRVHALVSSSNVGNIVAYGQNGNFNASITNLSNYSNNGYFSVNDVLGQDRAAIYVNAAGQGVLFTSPANKNFRMEHPEQPGKDIWYCSLEGPEAGVYDRGEATLKNGEAFIAYSDHFLLVMNPETVTVSLTPRSWDTYGLAVTEVTERGFRVRELKNGTGNFAFFWEVKGKIRGHEDYRVIRDRSESMPATAEKVSEKKDEKSR